MANASSSQKINPKSLPNTFNINITTLYDLKKQLLYLIDIVDIIIEKKQEINLVQSIHNLEYSVNQLCIVLKQLLLSNHDDHPNTSIYGGKRSDNS